MDRLIDEARDLPDELCEVNTLLTNQSLLVASANAYTHGKPSSRLKNYRVATSHLMYWLKAPSYLSNFQLTLLCLFVFYLARRFYKKNTRLPPTIINQIVSNEEKAKANLKARPKQTKTTAKANATATANAHANANANDSNSNSPPDIHITKNNWFIFWYKTLPLNALSRFWGNFNQLTLPTWFRPYGYRFYIWLYNVNFDEIKDKNLSNYLNLGQFFYRNINLKLRPIDNTPNSIVSPVDGTVLKFGIVHDPNGEIEQVKGLTYTIKSFLGVHNHDNEYDLLNSHSDLYFTVIYLSPGDYHHFHSPVNWTVKLRRHFPGRLFSVSPFFQKNLKNLFILNERVPLLGSWKYGFFSMTLVGATNVGSINLNFDKDLKTNQKKYSHINKKSLNEKSFCYELDYTISQDAGVLLAEDQDRMPPTNNQDGVPLTKGEEMGGFKFGSTVVICFQAPKDFKFNIQLNERIKMGQLIGSALRSEAK
ncbi:hypothetical protein TBLA_0D00180 [Henningerozyma blattae CBS 6284]|uniref:Phosphatidylserine decarboxylase proenzyme 1, mitochondrial n=1 Tax=Henningerozyma blattae (strain ATCC 34711 / CBS 6284 / DSM 70876 / NBRC 10599 / NRRL Y-10934 / UCD 77-7) TaxID=1071380 RepID=I2H2C6_HENB6|nr:hypothetical protein TBLA_0D00180 [Tetrapisispora blattae CBS 6284]CCH60528.1 hypothetical protein TBLA_0D00180 [Tetrapisispora blattae CBS 6284]